MKKTSRFLGEVLINPSFQIGMVARFILPVLLVIVLNYYFIVLLGEKIEKILLDPNVAQMDNKLLAIAKGLDDQIVIYIFSNATLISILFYFGVVYSFRIAGPAYRMKKHFQNLDPENMRELKFRKKDLLQDVSDEYNQSLERFKK